MNKQCFPDRLILERLGEGRWRLENDYRYFIGGSEFNAVTVPKGFITDGASVPQILWSLLPPEGEYFRAAIIHDRLYRPVCVDGHVPLTIAESERLVAEGVPMGHLARPGSPVTRKQADDIFMLAMVDSGVGWWRRWAVYLGVRVGGWACWRG